MTVEKRQRVSRDALMGLALLHGLSTVRAIVRLAEEAQFCTFKAAVEDLVERLKNDPTAPRITEDVADVVHDIYLLHEVLHELRSVDFSADEGAPTDGGRTEEEPDAPEMEKRVILIQVPPRDKNDIN